MSMEESKNIDIKKFHWGEVFNDTNGLTCLSKICSGLIVFTGCFGFIIGSIHLSNEILVSSTAIITIGAGLLGIRRFTLDQGLSTHVINTISKTDNPNENQSN